MNAEIRLSAPLGAWSMEDRQELIDWLDYLARDFVGNRANDDRDGFVLYMRKTNGR